MTLRNGGQLTTPLLLPSFSSKTLQDESVKKMLEYLKATITDELLVSAYDVYYREINPKQTKYCSTVFLDSGGYEASQDVDLSDQSGLAPIPKPWRTTYHNEVLAKWDFSHSTVIVSYDNPRAKVSIKEQIARATKLFAKYPDGTPELLLKTETKSQRFLNIPEIIKQAMKLSTFSIVGVTEKELGGSTLDRMLNIARIRKALNALDQETPIHVFGSLDTVSSVLYFIAGADIFDGLTWLRYAFDDGHTMYKHNYGSKKLGITLEDFKMNGRIWNDNYYYLLHLKEDMGKFLLSYDFKMFRDNAAFFESANQIFQERLKEI